MFKIYNEDCLLQLDKLEENSIDSIVTDPPYGLTSITKRFGKDTSAPAQYGKDGSFSRLSKGFMGKEWDGSGIEYNVEMWQKCLRVLKPGGYLLAFGGSRTFHRIAVAIEYAGFEIRDTIMWLYGSGFPKSMSLGKVIEGKYVLGSANVKDIKKLKGKKEIVGGGWNSNEVEQGKRKVEYEQVKTEVEYTTELGKQWQGWGTALKPSFEPIIVARKPFEGSLVDNVIEYGVGGINIDECRVGEMGGVKKVNIEPNSGSKNSGFGCNGELEELNRGRFPANTILTYDDTDFEEVCGGFPNTKNNKRSSKYNKDTEYTNTYTPPKAIYTENNTYGDSGSASRYFYCAKASKKDRDEGLEEFEEKKTGELQGGRKEGSAGSIMLNANGGTRVNPYAGAGIPKKNIHPTVKPTELMQYLVRLVTPEGGVVLDPFMGSGSTGKAVMYENKERNKNYRFIGIEKDKEYCEIARARISYAEKQITKEQEEKDNIDQISLF